MPGAGSASIAGDGFAAKPFDESVAAPAASRSRIGRRTVSVGEHGGKDEQGDRGDEACRKCPWGDADWQSGQRESEDEEGCAEKQWNPKGRRRSVGHVSSDLLGAAWCKHALPAP
jgi:hypothetical protein